MTTTIEVTNSGPIEGTFTIDLSAGPGVYEFRGARGTGKTTAISSIDWLAGHKIDVTLHDNALSGKIEGFGVIAPIGGRKRRKGQLDLDTIDAEKFSLSDLVDPQGKTPEVRDARAIKALAVLSEAKADPALYHDLCGGQREYDALGISETDDPVLLATRIKEAFDRQARAAENTAQAEAAHAAPLECVPEDLDVSQDCDLKSLEATRDQCRDACMRIKGDREHGIAKERDIIAAQQRLTEITALYTGPAVDDAMQARQSAIDAGQAAAARVRELELLLQAAKAEVDKCTSAYTAAHAIYEAAQSHAAAVAQLRETASQSVSYPDETAIAQSEARVNAATEDYHRGIRIRDINRNLINAGSHRDAEKKARQQAAAARNTASQVLDILARSLRTQHIQILSVDGFPRLFVEHPKRGRTSFDRINGLSDGERVDVVLRELLPHITTPGLLPIPQRVWQDLQPSDRAKLHTLAVAKGLYLFGAQVDDGELRVIYYGDNATLDE